MMPVNKLYNDDEEEEEEEEKGGEEDHGGALRKNCTMCTTIPNVRLTGLPSKRKKKRVFPHGHKHP